MHLIYCSCGFLPCTFEAMSWNQPGTPRGKRNAKRAACRCIISCTADIAIVWMPLALTHWHFNEPRHTALWRQSWYVGGSVLKLTVWPVFSCLECWNAEGLAQHTMNNLSSIKLYTSCIFGSKDSQGCGSLKAPWHNQPSIVLLPSRRRAVKRCMSWWLPLESSNAHMQINAMLWLSWPRIISSIVRAERCITIAYNRVSRAWKGVKSQHNQLEPTWESQYLIVESTKKNP